MNDQDAIRRCQEGDRDAFRHLVDQYQDVLYGTAYLMTGDAAVAEEQVQEAFVSAWKGIRGFRIGQPIKPWLVRILVNRVLSERRRRSVPTTSLEDVSQSGDAIDPGEQVEILESRDQVRRAVSTLSVDHRQVVMLRYFTDLSVPEIAYGLGCRQGTVKSRLHRALAQLRQTLGK